MALRDALTTRPRPTTLAWWGLALLLGIVAWRRYAMLSLSPLPVGIDGYYYPLQLRSLLERGQLVDHASPLAFWAMAPLAWLTDPVTGAKLGTALGGVLPLWPLFILMRRLLPLPTGPALGAAWFAVAVAGTAASANLLAMEFPKQSLSTTFVLAGLVTLTPARGEARLPRRAYLRFGVAWLLALATHKTGPVIMLGLAVPRMMSEVRTLSRRPRRIAWVVMAGLGLGLVAWLLTRAPVATGLLTRTPDWRGNLLGGPAGLSSRYEVWQGALASLALGVWWWHTPQRLAWLPWWVLGLGLALPWLAVDDPQGVGFRLRLLAWLPLAMAAGGLAVAALRAWPRFGALGRAVATALILAFVPMLPPGVVFAHPQMDAAMQQLAARLPANAHVLVPERQLAFMAAWHARHPTTLAPRPGVPAAATWRVVSRWYQAELTPLAAAAPPGYITNLHGLENGLWLVSPEGWRWLLEHASSTSRARLLAWPTI